jgi:hypothetical protein
MSAFLGRSCAIQEEGHVDSFMHSSESHDYVPALTLTYLPTEIDDNNWENEQDPEQVFE